MSKTDIWAALGKTDPAHTKRFQRSGGFKGTAIKPIWIIQRLTEYFGPVGVGWGMDEPSFQVVPAGEEILVYCTVKCWHTKPENALYGVGGDKVLAKFSSGLKTDDEAFKKAFTDAVGNAFKFVGVGADVHMGQFDDSKYVREVGEEFQKDSSEASVNGMPDSEWANLVQLVEATGSNPDQIAKHYKVSNLRLLNQQQYGDCVGKLKDKLAERAKADSNAKASDLGDVLEDEIPY